MSGARGRVRRGVTAGAVAVVWVLAAVTVVVQGVGQAAVRGSVQDVPPSGVVIVPGAGLRPDGTPSTYLRRRLDAAAELYAQGTVEVVLVSGDNRTPQHDEPTAMRDWLVERGVPADRVVRDHAGLDTHDTCVRAHDVFGVEEAVVVTQSYHLRRMLFSCRAAGIDVTGVGVSAASVEPAKAVVYRVRELPASWRAALDAVTRRPPVHGGPVEPGVTDVLARVP
ncbi:SanA/YdcF family protein [Cellulomonas fimi]|uniref:SanA/YdcF family protein n=1 Tax=Cellulomonas fimi TaxID=1708 RepID=UPI001E5FB964|nr:ElyC/SanA/YdcF family protein [Cellulomonas fimi]